MSAVLWSSALLPAVQPRVNVWSFVILAGLTIACTLALAEVPEARGRATARPPCKPGQPAGASTATPNSASTATPRRFGLPRRLVLRGMVVGALAPLLSWFGVRDARADPCPGQMCPNHCVYMMHDPIGFQCIEGWWYYGYRYTCNYCLRSRAEIWENTWEPCP